MSTNIESLKEILDSELESYKKLLNICREEQRFIINNNTADLEASTGLKEKLIRENRDQEQMRMAIVESVVEEMGFKENDTSLSEIIKNVDAQNANTLKKLQENLHLTIQELDRVNRENATLLIRSIEFVDESIRLFKNASNSNPTYSENGRKRENILERQILDQKI